MRPSPNLLPNLFIVGAPKCATTSLARHLAAQHGVFLPHIKEPFFLASDFGPLNATVGVETLSDYQHLFSDGRNARYRIDASTNYMWSSVAIGNALTISPAARFVAVLRDPVDVAVAFHGEQLFVGNEDQSDFQHAWRLQDDRLAGRSIPPRCKVPRFLQYREVAAYETQAGRLAQIPPDQLLVLDFDELTQPQGGGLRRVHEFLGLAYDGQPLPVSNAAKAHRFGRLGPWLLAPPPGLERPIRHVREFLLAHNNPVVDRAKAVFTVAKQRPEIPDEFRRELEHELGRHARAAKLLLNGGLPELPADDGSTIGSGREQT